MEEYYNSYLINSVCYKNLSSAISNTNTQIEHVKQLINAFSNASGNNIDLIKIDLDGIQSDLTSYASMLQGILNQLIANANKFDKVLKEWKANIGKDYSSPVETPAVPSADLKTLCHNVMHEKIEEVSVSENGYINVKVKSYVESIEQNVADKSIKKTISNISYNVYNHGFYGFEMRGYDKYNTE